MRGEGEDALGQRGVEAAAERLRDRAPRAPRSSPPAAAACTPASVRAATASVARTPCRRERGVEGGLHGGQAGLALEAAEGAAVVGDLDGVEASFHVVLSIPHPMAARTDERLLHDDPRLEGGEWLFRRAGQVFGPVDSRGLAAMLYRGEIDGATPVSSGDGAWRPLGAGPDLPRAREEGGGRPARGARGHRRPPPQGAPQPPPRRRRGDRARCSSWRPRWAASCSSRGAPARRARSSRTSAPASASPPRRAWASRAARTRTTSSRCRSTRPTATAARGVAAPRRPAAGAGSAPQGAVDGGEIVAAQFDQRKIEAVVGRQQRTLAPCFRAEAAALARLPGRGPHRVRHRERRPGGRSSGSTSRASAPARSRTASRRALARLALRSLPRAAPHRVARLRDRPVTPSAEKLAARAEDLPEGSVRRRVLEGARRFKAAWVELGRLLVRGEARGPVAGVGLPELRALLHEGAASSAPATAEKLTAQLRLPRAPRAGPRPRARRAARRRRSR